MERKTVNLRKLLCLKAQDYKLTRSQQLGGKPVKSIITRKGGL